MTQSVCMHRLMDFPLAVQNIFRQDTICVYAQIDGIDGCLFVHVKSDTICTYTQIDGSWATLTLICVSTRSVYVQVDKNNK